MRRWRPGSPAGLAAAFAILAFGNGCDEGTQIIVVTATTLASTTTTTPPTATSLPTTAVPTAVPVVVADPPAVHVVPTIEPAREPVLAGPTRAPNNSALPDQHCLDDPINTTIRPVLRGGLSILQECYSVVGTVRSVLDERIQAGGATGADVYVHVLIQTDDGNSVVAIVPPGYARNGGRSVLTREWGFAEGDRVFATGALTYDANRATTVLLPTWEIVRLQ